MRFIPKINSTNVPNTSLDIVDLFDIEDLSAIFKNITLNNGSKFTKLPQIEKAAGINMYFARPYRSSDKPHVERQNRLIKSILNLNIQTIITTDFYVIDHKLIKSSKIFNIKDGKISIECKK